MSDRVRPFGMDVRPFGLRCQTFFVICQTLSDPCLGDVSSQTLIFTCFNIFLGVLSGCHPPRLLDSIPDTELTSIPELDIFRYGEPLFTIGRITGYKCEQTSVQTEGTNAWTDLQQNFVD